MTRKQKMRIKRKQWKLIKTRVNSVCKKLDRLVVVEDFKPDWVWNTDDRIGFGILTKGYYGISDKEEEEGNK